MDDEMYIQKYGEPETLEEILNYCAFVLGQGGLEHRTLRHFSYFVDSLVFGEAEYETFVAAYKDKEIPKEGTIEYFGYTIAKGRAEDALKIFTKYHPVYSNDRGNLLEYAKAFKQYCLDEYGSYQGA